jgi:hypothetical protein
MVLTAAAEWAAAEDIHTAHIKDTDKMVMNPQLILKRKMNISIIIKMGNEKWLMENGNE